MSRFRKQLLIPEAAGYEGIVVAIRVKRTKEIQAKVEAKVANNQCLVCDEQPIHKLGLCIKCSAKHDYRIRLFTSQRKRVRYIRLSAENGHSLVPGEQAKLRAKCSSDPAASLAGSLAT